MFGSLSRIIPERKIIKITALLAFLQKTICHYGRFVFIKISFIAGRSLLLTNDRLANWLIVRSHVVQIFMIFIALKRMIKLTRDVPRGTNEISPGRSPWD
jgi:hypothetical protein